MPSSLSSRPTPAGPTHGGSTAPDAPDGTAPRGPSSAPEAPGERRSRVRVPDAVALGRDVLGDASVDAMRRYLLQVDVVDGYFPQLVYGDRESRLWTSFWFGVRRIDDLIDRFGFDVLDRLDESEARGLDFARALRAFRDRAPVALGARRRLLEMSWAPLAEKKVLLNDRAPSARELLHLWYFKAYVPTYVGHHLLLVESDDPAVRRLAKLSGAALQWLDDLFDLFEDLRAGRAWLCREELELVGLDAGGPARRLPAVAVPAVVRLREAVSLTYFLAAYDLALTLPSAADRRRATLFLELFLWLYPQRRFRIYEPGEPSPWAPLETALRWLPGSESLKYRALHAFNDWYLASPLGLADVAAARRRLVELGGCPPSLVPGVCLEVMEELEDRLDRSWEKELTAGEPSPVARLVGLYREEPAPAPPATAAGASPAARRVSRRLREHGRLTRSAMRDYLRPEGRAYLDRLMAEYPRRGGAMLRPSLCLATARAFGGRLRDALGAATAIELLHNALLVHDDVEDGSEKRRGHPTLHELEGVPLAVNAGSSLILTSLQPLVDQVDGIGPRLTLRTLEEAERMALRTAEGQALELRWIRDNEFDLTSGDYLRMVLLKTCWYTTIFPCRLGALIATSDRVDLDPFIRFGFFLGAAFQIQDDLLNLVGDPHRYGKELEGDLWEGKRTLMLLRLFRRAEAGERARLEETMRRPRSERSAADVRWLRRRMEAHGCLDHARRIAHGLAGAARHEFSRVYGPLPPSPDKRFVEDVMTWIFERA